MDLVQTVSICAFITCGFVIYLGYRHLKKTEHSLELSYRMHELLEDSPLSNQCVDIVTELHRYRQVKDKNSSEAARQFRNIMKRVDGLGPLLEVCETQTSINTNTSSLNQGTK